MSSDNKPKVLLFGAGSVGTIYLYLLSKVSSVTAVCRSNYEVVKRDGFIINSSIFGQNIQFTPNVVRSCEEATSSASKPFDYVVVCSKAIPGTVPKIISPVVTPQHTAIVLIQNGVGIEDEYVAAFPKNPIVSAVVYLPASQRPAGVVTHGEIERLEIGSYPPSAPKTHASAFTDLVKSSGATAELHPDVQLKRWYKLVVNASWNPICALTLSKDTEFLKSSHEASELVFGVMLEVCAIAGAYGYVITREQAEFQLSRAKARIEGGNGVEPSMLQDVKMGRKMEVEAIVGNAVRMGKDKGVGVAKLEMVYLLVKALDRKTNG